MHPTMKWWRKILAADIIMHLIAVWWFAYLPPGTLNNLEKVIMVLATYAGVGVLAHAFDIINLPLERWSYLLAGAVCLLTLMAYETATFNSDIPLAIRVPFGLFLFAGAMSSFAAHVIDGAPRHHRGARSGR